MWNIADDPSFGTTDNITPHSEFPYQNTLGSRYRTPWVQDTEHLGFQIPNWTRGYSRRTQLRIYQNTHRRSTTETAMNPIGQAFPVINMHLVVPPIIMFINYHLCSTKTPVYSLSTRLSVFQYNFSDTEKYCLTDLHKMLRIGTRPKPYRMLVHVFFFIGSFSVGRSYTEMCCFR